MVGLLEASSSRNDDDDGDDDVDDENSCELDLYICSTKPRWQLFFCNYTKNLFPGGRST